MSARFLAKAWAEVACIFLQLLPAFQEGFLSGCGVPQPCVPMEARIVEAGLESLKAPLLEENVSRNEASELWDECRFDISHCGQMVPNSFCWILRVRRCLFLKYVHW